MTKYQKVRTTGTRREEGGALFVLYIQGGYRDIYEIDQSCIEGQHLANTKCNPDCVQQFIMPVFLTICVSLLAYQACYKCIPPISKLLMRANITGRDVHKPGAPLLPEAAGLAAGFIYILALIAQMLLFVDTEMVHAWCAASMSITAMLLLGFVDDVLDLKWKHKVLLPAIAVLPSMAVYRIIKSSTSILLPWPLHRLFGIHVVELGSMYYIWMLIVATFCTHSINIHAGINGLEVGQSIIIAISACISAYFDENYLVIRLLLPFIGASLALYQFNRYPSRVFVGDVYCYFAGMTLAVTAILGAVTKTMMLWFVPQAINFGYSLLQLSGWIECPRHRMPRNTSEDVLTFSTVTIKTATRFQAFLLDILGRCKIVHVDRMGTSTAVNNMTLMNWVLFLFGPMHEAELCACLLVLQAMWCAIGMCIRHPLAKFFYSI